VIEAVDVPAAGPAAPSVDAWLALEHRSGVLPLIEALFEPGALPEVVSGGKLGALGLFTPSPGMEWGGAAVEGETAGSGVLLRGLVRLPSPAVDGALVLAKVGEELRLAWVEGSEAEKRGSRSGGPLRAETPCWLALDGVTVGSHRLSRPVTLDPGSPLVRHLEAYAVVWASAAAQCARDGVQALRRAARTAAFNASQLVALGITEVEIESELTSTAVQRLDGLHGLAVAAAASRTLAAVAAKTEELRDAYGLEIDGPLASDGKVLTAFLGGPLMLESALAGALNIGSIGGIGTEARG
jgi:hypothetical protein